jgi:hypothetical protein
MAYYTIHWPVATGMTTLDRFQYIHAFYFLKNGAQSIFILDDRGAVILNYTPKAGTTCWKELVEYRGLWWQTWIRGLLLLRLDLVVDQNADTHCWFMNPHLGGLGKFEMIRQKSGKQHRSSSKHPRQKQGSGLLACYSCQ